MLRYVCTLFQDYLTKRVVSCHAVVGVEDSKLRSLSFGLLPQNLSLLFSGINSRRNPLVMGF